MTNNEIRVELPFDSTSSAIETAINNELVIIDGLSGSVVGYAEGFNYGMNNYFFTIIYTTP